MIHRKSLPGTAKLKIDEKPVAAILERLSRERTLEADGKLSFQGFTFLEIVASLSSHVSMPSAMAEADKYAAVRAAALAAAKHETLTRDALVGALQREVSTYLNRKSEQYVLLTSVSIDRAVRLPTRRISGGVICFGSGSVPYDRNPITMRAAATECDFASPYLPVRCSISARSPEAALEKALDALDLLRSIWNFVLNYGRVRYTSGRFAPVNMIVVGHLHTLHWPSGKLALENFWYDPYFEIRKPRQLWDSKSASVIKGEREIRRKLRRHRYAQVLKAAFLTYCRALDGITPHETMIELWAILESLTGTSRHEDVVKRAGYIWFDAEYHYAVLNHLRKCRNRMVHAAEGTKDGETALFQLKGYVEALLMFHLNWGNRFAGFEEACAVLALPNDHDDLRNAVRQYRLAMAVRTRKKVRKSP